MTDKHDEGAEQVAQLLRLAGPRDAVPPERAMRVRAAVREEWRRHTTPRARTISIGWPLGALAAAALLLLGVRARCATTHRRRRRRRQWRWSKR